jgi:osomolarity two-component system sensor histidine kinase SLN1
MLYARSGDTPESRLLNITSDSLPDITLPYTDANGSAVMLGDNVYPPMLYPNLTYTRSSNETSWTAHAFPDYTLGLTTTLMLGPLWVNDSFSLVSLTLPIVNNTSDTDLLGFMTYVIFSPRPHRVSSELDANN